jgi:uncharacterized protein involved in exopolysaccharide biosynthesis
MAPDSPTPSSDKASTDVPSMHRLNPSDDEDIIDLGWYVRALQRRWKLAVAGAIVGGGLGFWYASYQPLKFQGVTTLLVVPPAQPTGAQINPATFQAIVENATLASQVIDELKLQGEVTLQAFLERALTVEEVRGTNIVKVKVTLSDPKLAAEASHRLAQKAIVLTQQVSQQEGVSIQDQLKNHLNDAQDRVQKAQQELLDYKQRAQVDLIKEDTDAMLKERGDLLQLVVDIEAERARLAAAEQEIKRQQPVLSVARVPSAEDALRRSAGDALQRSTDDALRRSAEDAQRRSAEETPKPIAADERRPPEPTPARGAEPPHRTTQPPPKVEADPQHLDLSNPFVNPVYQTLDFQIATSRARIAALEKQRDELIDVKKLGGKELAQLSELYQRQINQARLQANYDLATRVYGDLAVRYEQSRTQPLGNAAQLQVVDDAIPPDHPVARKRLQFAVYGAAVGLMGAMFGTWLRERRRS